MLTPLEREQHEALKFASKQLTYTRRIRGQNDGYCDGVDLIRAVIAKAEAKEAESAQQEHDRMIALRLAECPDNGDYLNASGGRV